MQSVSLHGGKTCETLLACASGPTSMLKEQGKSTDVQSIAFVSPMIGQAVRERMLRCLGYLFEVAQRRV